MRKIFWIVVGILLLSIFSGICSAKTSYSFEDNVRTKVVYDTTGKIEKIIKENPVGKEISDYKNGMLEKVTQKIGGSKIIETYKENVIKRKSGNVDETWEYGSNYELYNKKIDGELSKSVELIYDFYGNVIYKKDLIGGFIQTFYPDEYGRVHKNYANGFEITREFNDNSNEFNNGAEIGFCPVEIKVEDDSRVSKTAVIYSYNDNGLSSVDYKLGEIEKVLSNEYDDGWLVSQSIDDGEDIFEYPIEYDDEYVVGDYAYSYLRDDFGRILSAEKKDVYTGELTGEVISYNYASNNPDSYAFYNVAQISSIELGVFRGVTGAVITLLGKVTGFDIFEPKETKTEIFYDWKGNERKYIETSDEGVKIGWMLDSYNEEILWEDCEDSEKNADKNCDGIISSEELVKFVKALENGEISVEEFNEVKEKWEESFA